MGQFILYQRILAQIAEMEPFYYNGAYYLATLGKIYKWDGSYFREYQNYSVSSQVDVDLFTMNGDVYLSALRSGSGNSKIFKLK